MLVRTVYADAIVLGLLQRLAYNGLAEELATLSSSASVNELRAIERRLSLIRNTVWSGHTSAHVIVNDLLRAYQQQHRLSELVEEVHVELADAARLAELESTRRVELLLTLLTVMSAASGLAALGESSGLAWVGAAVVGTVAGYFIYRQVIWRR